MRLVHNKYEINGRRSKRRRFLAIFAVLLVLAVAAILINAAAGDESARSRDSLEPAANSEVAAEPGITSVEGRYLFSGTIVLARAVESQAKSGAGTDYNQPFSGLDTFEPEKYDGWLADLECPVTGNQVSYQQQVANLVFNCRPEWLPAFSKYFSFVNLANNHTSDMGKEGFLETQAQLDKAGLQIVGNYDPAVKDDICEVMALPVRLQSEGGEEREGTLPVAFCAWHYFFRKPEPGEMEVMQKYAEIMPVFGFMHVGAEYLPQAGAEQSEVARKLIDLGSEFVVGNSPHWVQNTEVYNGKLILYSTGNFIFDQLDSETNRGVSLDARFTVKYEENTAKWLALGDKCKTRRDSCLDEAKSQGLSKLKLEMQYEPVASSNGYREITKRADPSLQAAVEERLNWASTLETLKQTSGQ